jgi:hypothetical protein
LTAADEQRPPSWVFGRGAVTIAIRRVPPLVLRIESSEANLREFFFSDIDELTAFQCGFELHLLETGWSLLDFASERRLRGSDPTF